ncbi:hypothetical protein [Candidatus Villigracilis saccharophilus]|uniref:hypothetical protein n=1 Tax=Candidatus Villigracilis saccharophilus TaxID=3140684 RepID=UPI00313490BE|nr:hypothetical protein [Anaerolineales bacterium]
MAAKYNIAEMRGQRGITQLRLANHHETIHSRIWIQPVAWWQRGEQGGTTFGIHGGRHDSPFAE